MNIDHVYGRLRKYQKEALDIMAPLNRVLEFDDMGLGKTLTILTDIERKHQDHDAIYNFLILCSKNALYVWKDEIKKWFNKGAIVYSGTPKQRTKLWEAFITSHQVHYLITTYAMLDEIIEYTELSKNELRFALADMSGGYYWDAVSADEIHLAGLLNHKSKTFKMFEKFARTVPYVYLATGTPVRQGVVDLFAPCNIVNRQKFTSYWQFVGRYCITLDTPFGKSIERRPRDPEQFRTILNQFMIRRTKEELRQRGDLSDLPGKQRQSLLVEMTSKQREVHDALIKDMCFVDETSAIVTPNTMSLILRLRQLLTCPRLLGIDDDGAALEEIAIRGAELIDNGNPFVVFTPFSQALPYIANSLKKSIGDLRIYKIHGGMTAQEFAHQWQGFQEDRSRQKVLLCVIKSGASFHATTAAYGFFLGYEWDFNFNIQSEDRLCRIGQPDFVNIYYMMHKDTIDEDVAQRLNDKQEASNWIIGDREQYELLKKRYHIANSFGK